MKTILNLKATWAWVLCLCLAATFCACDNDDDGNTTVPDSVTESMVGYYDNFLYYDGKLTADVMKVTVSSTSQVEFSLPYSEIVSAVVADDVAGALATLKGDNVKATFRPVYYNKGVASYLMDTQTASFSYTAAGKKTTGSVTLKNPSISFDSKTGKLILAFSINDVSIGGTKVSGFKVVTAYMKETEKKY